MYSSSSSQLPLDVAHQTSSGSSILSQHHPYNQQLQQNTRRSSFPNISPPNISQYSQSSMATFFVMPDGGHQSQNSKPPRRRRSAAGSEPVKHRRTRSGCFTCRMRRVKVALPNSPLPDDLPQQLTTMFKFSATRLIQYAKVSQSKNV